MGPCCWWWENWIWSLSGRWVHSMTWFISPDQKSTDKTWISLRFIFTFSNQCVSCWVPFCVCELALKLVLPSYLPAINSVSVLLQVCRKQAHDSIPKFARQVHAVNLAALKWSLGLLCKWNYVRKCCDSA